MQRKGQRFRPSGRERIREQRIGRRGQYRHWLERKHRWVRRIRGGDVRIERKRRVAK